MKKITKFWNNGCMNCKMLEKYLAEVKTEFTDIMFVEVNTTDEPAVADKYDITTLPTLVFEKDGAEVGRLAGLKPKSLIVKKIDEVF
ncbi:MAG: thioredoxin family protein [Firmicutes bacterium]|nr:thioredoxin family protein [Bacillota bacterium]